MNILDEFFNWEEGRISSHEFCVKFRTHFEKEVDKYRSEKLLFRAKIKRYMVVEEEKPYICLNKKEELK